MTRITIPGDENEAGSLKFLNLSLQTYLALTAQDKPNRKTIDGLRECLHSTDIKVYLTHMETKSNTPYYELIAINKDNKTKGFKVCCDEATIVKDIQSLAVTKLSVESQLVLQEIQEMQKPAPSYNRLAR